MLKMGLNHIMSRVKLFSSYIPYNCTNPAQHLGMSHNISYLNNFIIFTPYFCVFGTDFVADNESAIYFN